MNCAWCNQDINIHTETKTTECLKLLSKAVEKHVMMLRSTLG